MAKQEVPFVDRDEEMALIDGLIGQWDTRHILFVHGPGGIGKSRLLQEVHSQYRGRQEPLLQVADILDFHDRSLHISESLGRHVANLLDPQAFDGYLRSLLDWRRMEMAEVSPERLTQEGQRVDQAFLDGLNTLTAKRRVVLLVDTIDALGSTEALRYVMSLGLQAKNVLLIVAGRNARAIYEALPSDFGDGAHLMELEPLGPEASEQYLLNKQQQLHVTIDEELRRKLLLLAQGRPIIIDLAVAWLSHDIPLTWLLEVSQAELEQLSGLGPTARQEELEYKLVCHIGERRTQLDRLILLLSRVYPLDVQMIARMLNLPIPEAQRLFDEARSQTFVKSLPLDRIALHDNFQEMLLDRLWPTIDPYQNEMKGDSRLAILALEEKMASVQLSLRSMEQEQQIARREKQADRELGAFLQREALEREYWVLAGRRLEHQLFLDLDQGIETFRKLFDQATEQYRFSFRETVLTQVQHYYAKLSPAQQYEVDNRRVRYWLDHGRYETARSTALDVLRREDLTETQRTDMLILLGNLEIRLGNLGEGVTRFEQAVKISANLQDWHLRANTSLGWGYRMVGRLNEAARIYREAYPLSIEFEDRKRQAWLLNNWAFVLARRGDVKSATALCKRAEALWHAIDFQRGLGAVYEVYAEAYSRAEQLDTAKYYYQKALDIFEPQSDNEWLARVYTERGRAYWLAGEYDSARDDLERGLAMGTGLNRPMALHYLGHLRESQGDPAEATQYFRQCYEESRRAPDAYIELNVLGDLARMAVQAGEYNRLTEFEEKYQAYLQGLGAEEPLPRYDGLLLKSLGDLALGAKPAAIAKAATYYARGLPSIAEHESYTPFKIDAQLQATDRLFNALGLPPEQIKWLGTHMLDVWKKEQLEEESPEALPFFHYWSRGERAE